MPDYEVGSILSTKSLVARFSLWQDWFVSTSETNIFYILFGNCSGQGRGVYTDNMYFNTISSIGIVGLFAYLFLLAKIVEVTIKNNNYSQIGLCLIIPLFAFSLFNLPNTFFMIYLPMLLTIGSNHEKIGWKRQPDTLCRSSDEFNVTTSNFSLVP